MVNCGPPPTRGHQAIFESQRSHHKSLQRPGRDFMQYTELDQNLNLAGPTWAPVFSGETNRNHMEKWLGGSWKTLDLRGAESISESKGNGFDKIGVFSLHEFCPSKGGMVSMRFVNQGEWFWQNLTHWYVLCMFLLTRKFINKTVKRHGVYRRCDYSHLEHCIHFRNSRTQDVEHLQSKGRAKRSYFHCFRAWAMGGRLWPKGPTQ